MRYETWKILIRLSLSVTIFLAIWGVLAIAGPSLVDEKAVRDWAVKKSWLSFVSRDIRDLLVGYLPLFIALFLTVSAIYPALKNPADYLARHYFLKGPLLTLSWGPTDHDLPQPEVLFFFPPGSLFFFSPGSSRYSELSLSNNGAEAIKINRVELTAAMFRRISDIGTEMLTGMGTSPLHSESGQRDEGTGLEWKRVAENRWVIDTPFTLGREEKVELPGLEHGYDEQDENALTQLRSLVGLATLGIQFEITVFAEQGIVNSKLSAPLRVLLSLEEGGDGGIGAIINKFNVETEAERDRIRQAYERARQDDFRIRGLIAENLNKMEAVKRLEDADQAIALQPNDPQLHYTRGHILVEYRRYQEALDSLDKALHLGFDDPDLHLDRGVALFGLSRPREALDEVDRALAAHPDDAAAHVERGRILLALERTEDALAAFNDAIRLDAGSAVGYCGRGIALIERGAEADGADALADFDHAIELDPHDSLAHVGRALALSGRGRDDEVLAALEKALSLGFRESGPLHLLESLMKEDSLAKYRQLLDSYDLLSSDNSPSGYNSDEPNA